MENPKRDSFSQSNSTNNNNNNINNSNNNDDSVAVELLGECTNGKPLPK